MCYQEYYWLYVNIGLSNMLPPGNKLSFKAVFIQLVRIVVVIHCYSNKSILLQNCVDLVVITKLHHNPPTTNQSCFIDPYIIHLYLWSVFLIINHCQKKCLLTWRWLIQSSGLSLQHLRSLAVGISWQCAHTHQLGGLGRLSGSGLGGVDEKCSPETAQTWSRQSQSISGIRMHTVCSSWRTMVSVMSCTIAWKELIYVYVESLHIAHITIHALWIILHAIAI